MNTFDTMPCDAMKNFCSGSPSGVALSKNRGESIVRNVTKHILRGVVLALFAFPVSAQTFTSAPFETTCRNASGNGPVAAGGSVTCTLKANLSVPQGAPFTVTPPSGSTITACAIPDALRNKIVATPPGGRLPLFLTEQSPTDRLHTAIGRSTTVPANTCAYTWLLEAPANRPPGPPEIAPAGTIIGTETFTVKRKIRCGREITRQNGEQWISNGNFSAAENDLGIPCMPPADTEASACNPIAFSDVGFRAIISGGYLQCDQEQQVQGDQESEKEDGRSSSQPVVNTGMPAQTNCTVAGEPVTPGSTATCTVTNNLFLPTGGTLLVSPLTPNGTTVRGCSSSTPGIVVNGPGGTLPMATYTLLPFMPHGGTTFTFQAQLGSRTTVPANTCAFTSLGAANPAGIPGNTVVGTETISVPASKAEESPVFLAHEELGGKEGCGTELTQRAVSYVPNGSGVMWPDEFGGFDTYFPETTAAQISGGFLCRKGNSTTLSKFTNTGWPVEFSCTTPHNQDLDDGGTVICKITNNVLEYTGNTLFVSPSTPRGETVKSCSTTTPGVVATGPGRHLPIFSQTKGIIVSSGIIQAGALDSNGQPITTVPANTCAFTVVGQTPSALEAGTVLGTETVSIQPGSAAPELTQRTDVYENVGVAFGFNCSALVTALADSSLCVPPTSNVIAPFLIPVFDNSGNIVLGSAGVPEESVQDIYAGTSGFHTSGGDE
jgi:hypothetical protein